MAAGSTQKFLGAATIVAGLSLVTTSDAAERNRDDPSWWFRTATPSLSDSAGRERAKKRSYLSDYMNAGRKADAWEQPFPRPVRTKAKRKRQAAPVQAAWAPVVDKPEPPLVYQPEKLVGLNALDLTETAPADPLAAAIYGRLKTRASAIRVTPEERQAIVDFYRLNGFKPLWATERGFDERSNAVLRLMGTSAEDGMVPEDYLPPSLSRFDDDLTLIDGDISRLARLDLELSARALRYARHASGGRLAPNKLTIYHDIQPEAADLASTIKVFAWSPFPADYLKALQPRHPAYAIFKSTLAGLQKLRAEPGSATIRAGKPVKLGKDDARIALVRRHLAWLGYGEAEGDIQSPVLDDTLSARLKDFQKDARIRQTGMLDAATIGALNSRNNAAGVARLTYNMERLRWLPKNLGKRYVFVNQAAYALQVIDNDREVWRTNVIIGKATTQTVAFSDKMETVVFNPSWGIPPSIMKNEMLPRLRRDPGYLDRIGYRVLTPEGKIVRSRSIRWSAYKDKVPYLVLQPPSDDNAMGEIKFLFPNAHSIYMHDTPNRSLFTQQIRAMSHGCVRVENPRLFAETLLGLDAADIAATIDTGVSETATVTRETAVHLTYFTAWPAEDGRIIYYDDIYLRDERMQRAFTTMAIASR